MCEGLNGQLTVSRMLGAIIPVRRKARVFWETTEIAWRDSNVHVSQDYALVDGATGSALPARARPKVKVKPRRPATREMSVTQFARGVAAELRSIGF
jgi:hypothetical protein